MARGESPAVLRNIYTLFHVGTTNGVTDAQLLDRFKARSDLDSSEAAFAALLDRHGPMVLGVCRRALRNPDDVADAFQATFLILVRKANSVRVDDSLGRWLYGVSRRVAARAKLAAARRSGPQVREIELAAAPARDANLDELRDVLDEEIGRLPEEFRSAVVLCELEGLGHGEAARELGCAVGTVKSRLSRAREKLRTRLIRRGVAPTACASYVESASAAVPSEFIEATVKAAIENANGVVSPAVAWLIQGVLRTMFLNKLSMIAITVVASLALATTARVLARQAATPAAQDRPAEQRVERKVGVENKLSNTAGSTATDLGESNEQEDESPDDAELLRLDLQLLTTEVQSRLQRIEATHSELVRIQLSFKDDSSGQTRAATLQKSLERSRREYISKKKELARKLSELNEVESKVGEDRRAAAEGIAMRRTGTFKRGTSTTKQIPVQPAGTDSPAIPAILEKRLSGIEGKLDTVLRTLEDLKREVRK